MKAKIFGVDEFLITAITNVHILTTIEAKHFKVLMVATMPKIVQLFVSIEVAVLAG